MISQNGNGLALLTGGPKTLTRVESYGEGDAERLLLGLIEEWKDRGRPPGDDLSIYRPAVPHGPARVAAGPQD